jgi:3-oxoacyl-[acyl-carrier-protein] synthase II
MKKKRVVITGISAVTPIGNDLDTTWRNLLDGVSGTGPITGFDPAGYETRFCCEIKNFDPAKYVHPKQVRRMDRFTHFAVGAAHMLFEQTGYKVDPENPNRTGVILGCGMGGIHTLETYHQKLLEQGPSRMWPFFIPVLISNIAPGHISIISGAKGPNLTTTSACASGMHSVGYAYSDILLDRCDVMVCGGVEAAITPLAVSGFNAMKALSTRNEAPEKASRPFDKDRDGFVMGEGCGLLLIESLEHAKARGATILAEIGGFGASGDAYHMTAPPEDGEGMALAMKAALREAGMGPGDIDHINAHGTSTQLNDLCETRAIKTVFGKNAYDLVVTSNKSMFGHTLGAAGGIESVVSVKTILEGIVPPTINLETPDPECDLDYCPNTPRKLDVRTVLCNSFGFGGTNACMVFKRFEE